MYQYMTIPRVVGSRTAAKLSLLHSKVGRAFELVLVFTIPTDRDADAVATGQQAQLIQPADNPRRIQRGILPARICRVKSRHRGTELVVDRERAGHARARPVHGKDKTSGTSRGEDKGWTVLIDRDIYACQADKPIPAAVGTRGKHLCGMVCMRV